MNYETTIRNGTNVITITDDDVNIWGTIEPWQRPGRQVMTIFLRLFDNFNGQSQQNLYINNWEILSARTTF